MANPTDGARDAKDGWSDPALENAPETVKLSPAEEVARKKRNLMIAVGLVAFIVLIFLTTVVRMSSNYNAGAGG